MPSTYLEQTKSAREGQIYDFTCMWNLRNKTNNYSGKREENQSAWVAQ